jgi:hypothetical protein
VPCSGSGRRKSENCGCEEAVIVFGDSKVSILELGWSLGQITGRCQAEV